MAPLAVTGEWRTTATKTGEVVPGTAGGCPKHASFFAMILKWFFTLFLNHNVVLHTVFFRHFSEICYFQLISAYPFKPSSS